MKSRINILFAVAALLVSCGLADINYDESENPGDANMEISFPMDWSLIQGSKPDRMIVLGSRIANTINYGYILPEMIYIDSTVVQSLVWANGDYNVVCVSMREDMVVENGASLSDLSVALPVSTDEISGIGYVGDAGEIFADFKVHAITSDPESRKITLTPKNLNQNLTVNFSVQVSEDITVEAITATLTGVASKVYPLSGAVNYKGLSCVIMPVEKIGEEAGVLHYRSNINILGLFPPESAEATSGPGILQLAVSTKSHLGSRTFYAGVNMTNAINEAVPMIMNGDFNCYNISGPSCSIDIPETLKITTDVVIEDEKDGVDMWFKMENIDILL